MVIAEVMISNQKLHQMAQVCGFFHDCDLKLVFNFIIHFITKSKTKKFSDLTDPGKRGHKTQPRIMLRSYRVALTLSYRDCHKSSKQKQRCVRFVNKCVGQEYDTKLMRC